MVPPRFEPVTSHAQVTIRRATLMEDAFVAFAGMGSALKARLIITFVNEQGLRWGCAGLLNF